MSEKFWVLLEDFYLYTFEKFEFKKKKGYSDIIAISRAYAAQKKMLTPKSDSPGNLLSKP